VKIAILSDTRLPTSPNYAGHGLGQIVHAVANDLAKCGHEVTLFAAPGSEFEGGKLVTATDEQHFLRHDLTAFEAIMDNSHAHVTGQIQGLPAIQVSHDRESKPTANAVFPSKAHRDWHGFNETNSRIVHNGIKMPNMSGFGKRRGGYVAYLSMFYPQKQPNAALDAARLAEANLIMAGPTPPAPPPGSRYIGPLWGEDKFEFLYHADALIFPSSIECAPVTVLESQSVGTPVIVSAFGGSHENMQHEKTGFACQDTLEMSAAIRNISGIDRKGCREWVAENRNQADMVAGYEALLRDVAAGARW
jgi:glycosyltransferase involved in cell wall biosynthesis